MNTLRGYFIYIYTYYRMLDPGYITVFIPVSIEMKWILNKYLYK